MFGAIGTVLGWVFQAIVTTVVVEIVMGFFRRARERAAAKQAPAQQPRTEEQPTRAEAQQVHTEGQPTQPEEPPTRAAKAEKDVKPAARTTRRPRKATT
jgi:uncharacterized membrane protein YhiD involved in acid resistance